MRIADCVLTHRDIAKRWTPGFAPRAIASGGPMERVGEIDPDGPVVGLPPDPLAWWWWWSAHRRAAPLDRRSELSATEQWIVGAADVHRRRDAAA